MNKFELRPTPAVPLSKPSLPLLVVATALIGLALLAPLAIAQVRQLWVGLDSQAVTEPVPVEAWPTPPATYAAVAAVETVRPTPMPTLAPTPLPPPVWKELNYLTSVEFTASSVVASQRTTDLTLPGEIVLMNDLITDRLLLKAVGKVQMGINLGAVSNVQIVGDKISLVVPRPEVVSVELLPDQSQIYDSIQVWFLSQYEGLETEALEQARTQLRSEVADNASMTKLAAEMARLQLTEFLRKTGFQTVEITFQ